MPVGRRIGPAQAAVAMARGLAPTRPQFDRGGRRHPAARPDTRETARRAGSAPPAPRARPAQPRRSSASQGGG